VKAFIIEFEISLPYGLPRRERDVNERGRPFCGGGNAYKSPDMALAPAGRAQCVGEKTWSSWAPAVLERLLAVGGLDDNIPRWPLDSRARIANARRLLHSLRPKQPAVRPLELNQDKAIAYIQDGTHVFYIEKLGVFGLT